MLLPGQYPHQFNHFAARLVVQRGCWFIGKNDPWGVDKGAGNCHALHLSTGKVVWHTVRKLSQADVGELTSREREIAALVAGGLSNRDIADRLFVSRRTVDAHLNHIYAKLRISSRVQLTIWERDVRPGAPPDKLSPVKRA